MRLSNRPLTAMKAVISVIDQRDVDAAEGQHPASCHRPVRPEPVVDDAVDCCLRDIQEPEPDVLGVPGVRAARQHDDADEPDVPAPPDRNSHRVVNDIGVCLEQPF